MSCVKTILRRGSRGECVRVLQEALAFLGYYTDEIDGIFGPKTEQAVIQFQRDTGIQVDGIVGPQTWGMLIAYLEYLGLTDLICRIDPERCATTDEQAGAPTQVQEPAPTHGTTVVDESVIHVPKDVYDFIAVIGSAPYYLEPFTQLPNIVNNLQFVGEENGYYIFKGEKKWVDALENLVYRAWEVANNNVVYVPKAVVDYASKHYPDLVDYYAYFTVGLGETDEHLILGTIPEIKRQLEMDVQRIASEMTQQEQQDIQQPQSPAQPEQPVRPPTQPKVEPPSIPPTQQPSTRAPGGVYVMPIPRQTTAFRLDDTTILMLIGLGAVALLAMGGESKEKEQPSILVVSPPAQQPYTNTATTHQPQQKQAGGSTLADMFMRNLKVKAENKKVRPTRVKIKI